MKRISNIGFVLVSLFALTATASAEPEATGPGNNNGGAQRSARWQYEKWQSKREFYRRLAKKFHKPEPIPIDPGRGDGRVPVEPKPVEPQPPQGPPGFIFINGHWERVKANGGAAPNAPQSSTIEVRDHRTVVPGGGWQVRPMRPQDVSSSPGGVKVTHSPRWPIKDQSVYGGSQVRDHRTITTKGSHGKWDARPVPLKDVSTSPGGAVVRDHRGRRGNADR
jgi:hypothetical protein